MQGKAWILITTLAMILAMCPAAGFAADDAGLAPAVPDALGVASASGSEAAESYEDLVNAWRVRISADKKSSATYSGAYDETGMSGTESPKWVTGDKSKNAEGFVYGYVDLGLSDAPAMVVADPDAGYRVYGVYQCYEADGGWKTGSYITFPRERGLTLCEGGCFVASYNYPAMSQDGHAYNWSVQAMRAKLRLDSGNVAFDTVEGILYYTGSDHYWTFDSRDDYVFHAYGKDGAIASLEVAYAPDGSVEWHKIFDDFVAPSVQAAEGQSMHRLYNPYSGEHFYTSSIAERDMLAGLGWVFEGTGWRAPESSDTPVYRMYNPYAGEHHYTMDAAERDALIAAGWDYEGIGWYSDDAQSTPLFRDYNPNEFANNHNYTTDAQEHAALMSAGWKAEGYAWYGV